MEKLSYEQMFPEAIARLEMLNLHPHILENFREGVLSKTDTNMTVVKLTDEEKALVDKFERETGNLVYYVIFSNSSMCGESYTFSLFQPTGMIGISNENVCNPRSLLFMCSIGKMRCFPSLDLLKLNAGIAF